MEDFNARSPEPTDPIRIPITGTLDLHSFQPRDVIKALDAYIDACRESRIFRLRVVHGKGIGTLRQTVRARLGVHPQVLSFANASQNDGGWGATWVTLRPPERR